MEPLALAATCTAELYAVDPNDSAELCAVAQGTVLTSGKAA